MTSNKGRRYLIFFISLYLALIFIPLLSATEYTFKTSVKGKYSLENYKWVFHQPEFIHYILRSFWISGLSVVVTLLLLIPLQTWLHISQSPIKNVIETISLLPLIIPVVAYAIGAQIAMPLFVQDTVFELPFLYAMLSLPYTYRAIEIGLDSIPIKTLYEASLITGASRGRTIMQVIVPNSRTAILASSALGFALCLGEFTLTSLLHWDTFPTWINDISQDSVLGAVTLSVISLVIPIVVIASVAVALTKKENANAQ